jgi:uncharacterized protein
MKLLGVADVHGRTDRLARILAEAGPVDAILFAGDMTHFGLPDDAEAIVHLAQTTGSKVLAVAGNCDSREIDARLDELGVSLAGRGVCLDGVGFIGLPAIPPWRATMYHFTETELGEILDEGRRQVPDTRPLVVLSHVPPRGTKLDRVLLGRHVGSTALRAMVDNVQPELVVCGHIHEGRGIDRVGATTIVNCGPAGRGHYAMIELADGQSPQVDLRDA